MRIVKRNVYYCDFCKKRGLRSLKVHEKHCTANPDRVCRLCDNISVKRIIEKYKTYFKIIEKDMDTFGETLGIKYSKDFTLEDIKNELDYYCPNCILTIIRCVGLNRWYFGKKFKFDYQQELNEWWRAANKERSEREERETYFW